MSSDKYILLNCPNAKKLIKYTSSINNYLFYDDYIKFTQIKKQIKKQIKDGFINLLKSTISESKIAEKILGKDTRNTVSNQIPTLINKIPKKKIMKQIKKINLPQMPKMPKIIIPPNVTKLTKMIKPCDIIMQLNPSINTTLNDLFIKIGGYIRKFGGEYKLEIFEFIGYILSTVTENEVKKVIITSICDDLFLPYKAWVLREKFAIKKLSRVNTQIDKIIAKKYPEVKKMFDDKIITFKEKKIKAKYILNNVKKDVSIIVFNLVNKNISIKLQGEIKIINKDNVAFTEFDEKYKQIDIDNINEYLIKNIDDSLISKCVKK